MVTLSSTSIVIYIILTLLLVGAVGAVCYYAGSESVSAPTPSPSPEPSWTPTCGPAAPEHHDESKTYADLKLRFNDVDVTGVQGKYKVGSKPFTGDYTHVQKQPVYVHKGKDITSTDRPKYAMTDDSSIDLYVIWISGYSYAYLRVNANTNEIEAVYFLSSAKTVNGNPEVFPTMYEDTMEHDYWWTFDKDNHEEWWGQEPTENHYGIGITTDGVLRICPASK